jgi:hypothetical protein
MEQGDGRQSQNYRRNTTTPHTLRRVTPLFVERQHGVPRIGDIWIPKLVASPNHFVRLYIPNTLPNLSHFFSILSDLKYYRSTFSTSMNHL